MPHGERKVVGMVTLVEMLGQEKAVELCQRWAGHRLPSPGKFLQARRDAVIVKLVRRGHDVHLVAAQYGVGVQQIKRIVQKWLKKHGEPVPGKPGQYRVPKGA